MSHMGKPKGKVNPKFSLSQIKDAVAKALGTDVKFAPDCANAAEAAASLKPGEVLLLENLRFYPEEEGKPVGIDKAISSAISNVLSPLSWVVQRYLPKSVLSRILWTRSTTLSSAAA